MNVKAIIFDCDGVLVDSEDIVTKVWIDMAAERGVELDPVDFLAKTVGGTIHTTLDLLSEYIEINDRDAFVKEFRSKSLDRFTNELKSIDGIETLIRSLSCPMAIGSNGPKIKIMHNLKVTGLIRYFDEDKIFSGHDVGFKPKPDLFLRCAEALETAPENCLVIEDSMTGIGGARSAGIPYFFYNPHGKESDVPEEQIFTSMDEIGERLGV